MKKSSRGEDKIAEILTKHKITFKREVTFENLVGINGVPLRFDFGIYNKEKLICLIEFDGKQHFEFVKHFHRDQFGFKREKEWDRKKNKYCLLHNIPLIRIPYWDLDKLTFNSIFHTESYKVKDKYHLDNIKKGG